MKIETPSLLQGSALTARHSILCAVLGVLCFARCAFAATQETKVYRIGVIHQGGPYQAVVDGFRSGLKELGFEEGKKISLQVRDTKNDANIIEEAAKTLERDKVNLIYAITTSAVVPVKNATSKTPIVFAVGTDPVASGLVHSFAKPGGRLTGVQYSTTDLTAKRLEILKEILPKLNRVLILYNPNNPSSREAAELARKAAQQFRIQLIDRQASSVDELRQQLETIKAKEVDAFFYISDAMVNGHAHLIIGMARRNNLPTMFSEQTIVAMGGLASYGQNVQEVGRLSAAYVQKIISGAQPRDLRIEIVDKLELVLNLNTAKEMGLTIPPNVLARADRVIR
ncbi:MAG TPA: ABC transporter substrate-binding protein [Candidatus Binatia bacterium]